MDCKKCSRFMLFGDVEICDPCRNEQTKMDGLRTYYRGVKEYSLNMPCLIVDGKGYHLAR